MKSRSSRHLHFAAVMVVLFTLPFLGLVLRVSGIAGGPDRFLIRLEGLLVSLVLLGLAALMKLWATWQDVAPGCGFLDRSGPEGRETAFRLVALVFTGLTLLQFLAYVGIRSHWIDSVGGVQALDLLAASEVPQRVTLGFSALVVALGSMLFAFLTGATAVSLRSQDRKPAGWGLMTWVAGAPVEPGKATENPWSDA